MIALDSEPVVIVSHEYALLWYRVLSYREPHAGYGSRIVTPSNQEQVALSAHPAPGLVRETLRIGTNTTYGKPASMVRSRVPQILITGRDERTQCPHYKEHYQPERLPPGAFWKIREPNLYSVSPELMFAQLSKSISIVDLCMIGMELCGSYGMPYAGEQPLADRDPLTTPERIRRTLDELGGYGPRSKAGQALACIAPNSASPMESRLFLALCAPRRMGGLNLPRPVLNPPIAISRSQQQLLGKGHLECDLYWPEHKFALEYESREHHGQVDDYEATMARNAVLQMKGITVISLTARSVYDYDRLMATAREVKAILGVRHRTEGAVMQAKTQSFLRQLRAAPSI